MRAECYCYFIGEKGLPGPVGPDGSKGLGGVPGPRGRKGAKGQAGDKGQWQCSFYLLSFAYTELLTVKLHRTHWERKASDMIQKSLVELN